MEKLLKALVTEMQGPDTAPQTHDLRRLANLTGLSYPQEVLEFFVRLTPEAVIARYSQTQEGYDVPHCRSLAAQVDEVGSWLRQHLS